MDAAVARFVLEPRSSAETLDGISSAFFASLDGRPSLIALAVLVALGLFATVGLVRRKRREEAEEEELSVRLEEQAREHEAALEELSKRVERRKYLRAPAHVPMRILHLGPHDSLRIEEVETQNLGGGGVAFLTRTPPPPGTHLELVLVLDGHEIRLHGGVLRVEPGETARAPSLVALRFGDIDNAARERVVHAVTEEARRENERARRGNTCAVCHRPLASDTEDAHQTCRADPERIANLEHASGRSVAPPGSSAPKRR